MGTYSYVMENNQYPPAQTPIGIYVALSLVPCSEKSFTSASLSHKFSKAGNVLSILITIPTIYRQSCHLTSTIMTIPGITDPAVPYGSLVIVSGVTGFIGSHVADQALAAGYRVRGTTRSRSKGNWVEDHFQGKYGLDMFELVEVPDMEAKGAFDYVVEGKVTRPECFSRAHRN